MGLQDGLKAIQAHESFRNVAYDILLNSCKLDEFELSHNLCCFSCKPSKNSVSLQSQSLDFHEMNQNRKWFECRAGH